jgi:signal transduction histidine kinase
MVSESNRPIRMTQEELEAHPRWLSTSQRDVLRRPLRGWLAAPLVNRDGENLGLIQLSDKVDGDFTEEDENTLVQLAQMASVAVENARLYDAAQEALTVRDQFLSVASHELKTPLTTLTAHTQLMRRRSSVGQPITERDIRSLAVVDEQARRLRKLIENLLDLSRLQSGRFMADLGPVDLCALVRRVCSEAMSAEEGRSVGLDCDDEPLMVLGNELLLEQVLQNLVQNALKYSEPGSPVNIRARSSGEQATVSVTDRGIGVPTVDLPRLFEPFYRASNTVKGLQPGTGIGLYIVREIVANHNGSVDVDTAEGLGSTFTIRIPLLGAA